jgi:hypothetical protein
MSKEKAKQYKFNPLVNGIWAIHYLKDDTDLSSLPSNGFLGSGSLLRVLHPFKPLTDAPVTEAYMAMSKINVIIWI